MQMEMVTSFSWWNQNTITYTSSSLIKSNPDAKLDGYFTE